MTTKSAPFGSWSSPISADLIAKGTVRLGTVRIDGSDIYWTEARPWESGRNALVRARDGSVEDVLPLPFNSRTRVHEYGGGSFIVVNGTIYFSNFTDQRVYVLCGDGDPEPLTAPGQLRYADFSWDWKRDRLISVIEDHGQGKGEPINGLASIDVSTGEVRILASGHDFYSSPRVSPDCERMAWVSWDHPNMPWDSTHLWTAQILRDGELGEPELISGGSDRSVIMPSWSPNGILHFLSDTTGWWNIWRHGGSGNEQIIDLDAEFGYPPWTFGSSSYGYVSDSRILCAYNRKGTWRLAELDAEFGELEERSLPFTEIRSLWVDGDLAILIAGSPSVSSSLIRLDLRTGVMDVLRRSSDLAIDSNYLSRPEALEFPSGKGDAYAFHYPPHNKEFQPPSEEKPPLLVMIHGGPTSATGTSLNPFIQYWTSRGFAVMDVNYGGSSGYGRAYRERLKGNWGVVDVEDCVNGALHLSRQGLVDPKRLMIRGGSAGGYTTLAALSFSNVFGAGASYYGVGDLETLAKETHKFESRYLDGLIGPYPERRDLYLERSPLHHADRITSPVIFFQGTEDRVVPPDQAESMVSALRCNGVAVAYLAFEGEQHGFRRAESIVRSLEAELYFYSRVIGFDIADRIEPVEIENLGRR